MSEIKSLIGETLQLGSRAESLQADSPLLGAVPELDSQGVVHLITAIEDYFGFTVEDDEISADTFATLDTLVQFVERKSA